MHPSHPTSSISTTFVNTGQIATPVNAFFPQVVQAINTEEQPSTSQSFYPSTVVKIQCSEKMLFNIEREVVDDEFWNNFKEKLRKTEFYELFHNFVLTNWKPNNAYKQLLKIALETISKNKKSRDENLMSSEDAILYYDTSVEIFLHTNLKLRAMNLIFSLVDLDDLNSQLENAQLVDSIEIMKKINRKIDQINDQYSLIFAKVYIPYQMYLGKTDSQKLATDITVLKKVIGSLRSNAARYQGRIDEKHLPFINTCLLNLRLHQKIPKHVGKSASTKLITASAARFLRQESLQSPRKRCKSTESTGQTPKKKKTQPSSSTQPTIFSPELNQSLEKEGTSALKTLKTTLASHINANELKFVSFLNKMIGKDMYIYHEVNIHDDENDKNVIVNLEKYYCSLIMLSALKAQVLALKIKIFTGYLMQAETQINKINIRRELREKLRDFIDNHLIYEKNTAISLDERINQQSANMPDNYLRNIYFSNCNNIKNAKATLADTLHEYNKIIQDFDENLLLKCYFEFINSSTAMSRIKKNYFLSYERINQILQTVLNISSVSSLPKEKLSELKFKIIRPSVEDSFWQALKNENLSESELKHYYFCFILTNWKSSLNKIYELKQAIKKAEDNNLDLELRVNLVEKHFQEKLRYQAFHLIHHLLQLIDKCQKMKILSTDVDLEKKRALDNQMDSSFMKIKENYYKVSKIHSDYLIARRSPESIDIKKLNAEINTCKHYVYSNIKIDTEDTKLHILLINEILEKNKLFLFSTLLEQIYDYVNNDDIRTIPSLTHSSENHAEKQLQFLSIEKQNMQICTTSKLEPVSMQSVDILLLEPTSTQPLETLPINELDIQPNSLDALSYTASELPLTEPFLNFSVLNAESSPPSEMLNNSIIFSLTPSTSQQVSNIAEISNAQNHGQALKPSVELEQEQVLEQPMTHMEVNTLDFFNR